MKFNKVMAEISGKEKNLPIRLRIVFYLLIIYILTIPIFSLSIFYLNKVHHTVSKLLTYNVRLERISEMITLRLSEARRFEKRFLIFNDTFYITLNKDKIKEADSLATEGEKIAPELGFTEVKKILKRYNFYIDSLKVLEEKNSKYNIRDQIKQSFPQIQAELNVIITRMMATEDKQTRDSLMQEFNSYLEGKDTVVELYAYSKESPEVILLLEKMDMLENQINNILNKILNNASKNVETYQQDAIKWAAWGQRIIFSVTILLSFVIFYLIINYPRRFTAKLNRITNLLKRVEGGETDIKIQDATNDEIGELSNALSLVFTHYSEVDLLKREKILEAEARFRILCSGIQEKVAFIDKEMRIVYVNNNLSKFLNKSAKELEGKSIEQVEQISSLLPHLRKIIKEDLKGIKEKTADTTAFIIETIRNSQGDITGLLIIF